MSGVSGENAATSYSASSAGRIAHGAAFVITERLAELPDLALPSSLYKEAARPPAAADVLAYLQALLQKDPAAFLARYGSVLQSQELNHFEALRSADFEVDHWLGYYAAQRMAEADQAANPRRLPARVKNRRLAAMRRMAAQGEYFSDEAMRHRAPLLYHQQIGQFCEQEQQQQQQQQHLQRAEVAAAGEQRQQQQQGHAEGARELEGQAACGRGPVAAAGAGPGLSGGMGGSCLAAALRQALKTRDVAPAGAAASDPGPSGGGGAAAAATPGGAGRSAEGPADAHLGCTDDNMDVQMGSLGASAMAAGANASGDAVPVAAAAVAAAGGTDTSRLGRSAGRPDMLFSEFLMRQDDEAQLVMRRLQEQREEDAQMSEHDSDDEDDDEGEEDEDDEGEQDGGRENGGTDRQRPSGGAPAPCRRRRGQGKSASERAQMRRDFVSEMQSHFLLGQDGQYVDYGAIDADASLDGDWLEEEARDAEEKYFDED